ncbi:MAG: sugar ABC transporter ATP-binding protein [Gammaproteobacteria bacterium]|nr:sugar ABC transporter ATP-binding protein [Gammaproteobacteria bacterium]
MPEAYVGSNPPVLSLNGIVKEFPGVRALSSVSLDLYAGEVTALVGENGAGKSTLVKILTGIYQPDAGTISLDGSAITLPTPNEAARSGVTAIHQETVLFDELSVAENIFLGHAPSTRFGLVDWRKMNTDAEELLHRVGASIKPGTLLRELGIANKHLVAIARALSVQARVVIMDEPTAALSHKEIEELFLLVEQLKADGKAILFISHKFDEIFRIADRYSVFRDGELVGDGFINDINSEQMVRLMVGRSVDSVFPPRIGELGDQVLAVQGYSHPTEFDDISFVLRRGEILGFYGLVGAGRSEVMQALFGITRPSAGELTINGETVVPRSPADAIRHGLVYVPEDRGRQGAITDLPIVDNIALPSLKMTSNRGFVRVAEEYDLARRYTERLELKAAALDQHVGELSGGNQQKVVIAKWLATQPAVIILDEPTKGVDIGSKAAVHAFMRELASLGLAVIMVSSEIPEIIGMSDRVIVMREGRQTAEIDGHSVTPEWLVRAAAGIDEASVA